MTVQPVSPLVHFFSYGTGISIELPAGFELVDESPASTGYADLPEGGVVDDHTPLLRIRAVGAFEEQPTLEERQAAVEELADGFARLEGEVLRRTSHTVDEEPSATVVLAEPVTGRVLHLTAVAGRQRLVTLAGAGTGDEVAIWDRAVESIRVIEL